MNDAVTETPIAAPSWLFRSRLGTWARRAALTAALVAPVGCSAAGMDWRLPDARDVQWGDSLGSAYQQGIQRLSLPPYDNPIYLRSDFTFETNRIFVNYSGDISGRFIQIASLVSPPRQMTPATLPEVLRSIGSYQKADGHFGREVDWSQPLEPESSHALMLPIFWGNSRLLVGLLEAYRAFGRDDCLQAARRLGDFYIATAARFLDPAREPEYRMTGTYAAGYVTDYFPGIEGLALLYGATHELKYLRQAERMAEFFKRFDTLPIDHSHGNLVTHYGLLLLYEATGHPEYLERSVAKWEKAVQGGYVWPMGGVGEKFHLVSANDEGCSEADWLRLNLQLWKITGQTRFLDSAERLIWNHYAMNRTANGGYGHHAFLSDAEGPLLMQPQFTEAVWCCTFHGLLGLHTLKRHVIVGSPKGAFVNFPVDATAVIQTGRGRWKVSVTSTEPHLGEVQCRVRVDSADGSVDAPEIFIRRPSWATGVTLKSQPDVAPTSLEQEGYMKFPRAGAEGEVSIDFASSLRVEDRRLKVLTMDPKSITRRRGVTLSVGPHLLLANVDQPRPVLVARVGRDGSLLLPPGNRFPRVESVNAPENIVAKAAQGQTFLQLAPWEKTDHTAPTAFVFDLIVVPE